jgi:ABC-2 type transport system ATP-binding protein
MTSAIEINGLMKRFGAVTALNGIDLRVEAGTIYGLLGPNGAGKTTTIRVLATLLRPDAGEARVLGLDVVRQAAEVRSHISMTGQYASLDEDLSGQDNLVLVGRLFGLSWRAARERARELLDLFDLTGSSAARLSSYSGGMRRRLDIAAGLTVPPRLLFLDEPTTGLDPRSRVQVWGMVRAIAANGTTVLLTTQHMEEADQLAKRLAVIDHGRVIAEGTARELKAKVGGQSLHIHLTDPAQSARAREMLGDTVPVQDDSGGQEGPIIAHAPSADAATDLLSRLRESGITVARFSLAEPTLDEVFFALTGHGTTPKEEEGQA